MPRPLTLRLASFLGEIAAPHYERAGTLAARAAGLEPGPLEQPGLARLGEVLADPRPALLFVCGLPYVRARDAGAEVAALAAPVPAGEDAPRYWSSLVLRRGLEAGSAADLRDPLMAYNGDDSLSGWVLPRAALAPRGLVQPLYARTVRSGSHHRSLELLDAGEADAAAIDSTVLALEVRARPSFGELPVLEQLGPGPSPPAALTGGDAGLARELCAALVALDASPEGRAALEAGGIERYAPVDDAAYDAVRAAERASGTIGARC